MIMIYVLTDPTTGRPRYVGRTSKSVDERLSSHLTDARAKSNRSRGSAKILWIRSLLRQNMRPLIRSVEVVEPADASAREAAWIRDLRRAGEDLTNGSVPVTVRTVSKTRGPGVRYGEHLTRGGLAVRALCVRKRGGLEILARQVRGVRTKKSLSSGTLSLVLRGHRPIDALAEQLARKTGVAIEWFGEPAAAPEEEVQA